jgi:tetratricopeptide (TPR) repeat protein
MAKTKTDPQYRRSRASLQLLCYVVLASGSQIAVSQETGETAPTQAGANVEISDIDAETLAAGERALEQAALLELEILISDFVDEDRHLEAATVAEEVVERLSIASPNSLSLGVAIANLAILQRRAELYDASEDNFQRAVDVIREVDGQFSEAAINPLIGLGVTYRARGDYYEAITVFEEARTVSRRALGLMNERQIDILDQLSNTLVRMKDYEEADRHQLMALQLQERIHGADTMESLPAIYKFAVWLRTSFRYQEERDQYIRAMNIIREFHDESHPAMVKPLRETGISFRVQKFAEGRGVSALRRALEIAESQPEPDKRLIAEILVDIGDWNVAFSKVGPSGDEYRRAWAILGELDDGDELRRAWFDSPRYVLRENPSNRGLIEAGESDAVPGNVLVTFDVSDLGRTSGVAVVESQPPGLKDDSTARAINRSRFRPRMVDGEFVWVRGLARNFTYHYRPQE